MAKGRSIMDTWQSAKYVSPLSCYQQRKTKIESIPHVNMPYALQRRVYLELCQTSKIERFAKRLLAAIILYLRIALYLR